MIKATSVTIALCIITAAILLNCSKSGGPPVPVKEVQVEASYLSEEYDVYKYVVVNAEKRPMDATPDSMNLLLDYYENKYKDKGKVKVMIFPDAASAIQAITERVLAELEMENGKVIRRTVNAH
jgi:hypothetical protein